MDVTQSLLKAILASIARQTFPPADVAKIVAPTASQTKQIAAYNMCDGNTSQSEIGKRLKIDKGSLSHSISRWVAAGIVVRVGADQLPLHIYPLSKPTRN